MLFFVIISHTCVLSRRGGFLLLDDDDFDVFFDVLFAGGASLRILARLAADVLGA